MSIDRNLALELVRATEAAALACARHIGGGDPYAADLAAVEAMRMALARIEMDATVVIGEGDPTEAPALFVSERLGTGEGPRVEIAVDALEGSTLCATGGPNAVSMIAAAEEGGFLRVPDIYMDKITVGPAAAGAIDLDQTTAQNLGAIAEAQSVPIGDLTVVILDRPRHEKLIEEVRAVGSRIKLIKDGDVSAAIATCAPDHPVDVLLGIGGAREGVMAAAALRCRGGDMQARLRPRNSEEADWAREFGVTDVDAKLGIRDLASGNVMVAATGVTGGELLKGVRYRREGALTQSVVMRSETMTTRWIDSEHYERLKVG